MYMMLLIYKLQVTSYSCSDITVYMQAVGMQTAIM